jgi:hypothetical protein
MDLPMSAADKLILDERPMVSISFPVGLSTISFTWTELLLLSALIFSFSLLGNPGDNS